MSPIQATPTPCKMFKQGPLRKCHQIFIGLSTGSYKHLEITRAPSHETFGTSTASTNARSCKIFILGTFTRFSQGTLLDLFIQGPPGAPCKTDVTITTAPPEGSNSCGVVRKFKMWGIWAQGLCETSHGLLWYSQLLSFGSFFCPVVTVFFMICFSSFLLRSVENHQNTWKYLLSSKRVRTLQIAALGLPCRARACGKRREELPETAWGLANFPCDLGDGENLGKDWSVQTA